MGAKIRMQGDAYFTGGAAAGGNYGGWNADTTYASAYASASGFELKFYIDPITPNISYTSASGQTYFSP